MTEDTGWPDWSRVLCKKSSDQWRHDLEMRLRWLDWIFDSRIGEGAELKSVAADLYHALRGLAGTGRQVRGRPAKRVYGREAGGDFVAAPIDGDLLDALITFERKIMIYEAQSRETISDSLKNSLRHRGYGPEQHEGTSFDESHEVLPAGRILFVRLSRSSTEEKPSLHRHRCISMHSKETVDKCGGYGHTAKECWSSNHGAAEKPQMCTVWKETSWRVFDKELHIILWRFTARRMERKRKEKTASRTQRGGKFKGGKGGNHGKGKGKGKKGQRLNEITEPPEEQWTGGSWEQWPEQSWNAEIDIASWRDDD